jgi:starch phosphorylase
MAKLIIKLINAVADVINRDPQVNKILKVVFVPDFSVKTGQHIYPAADLSEQISTAGKEASGTGNMKFTMNGALTIGTLDGANVEIRSAVGEENFFLFGKNVQQVGEVWEAGYRPREIYHHNENLRTVIDLINSGLFSHGDREQFRPLTDNLLNDDSFLVCADFQDYIDCQETVNLAYKESEQWTRMSVLNVARCGQFSSDRAICEYNTDIWHAKSLRVEMPTG